ncbi:transcription-repair coupling factor [Salsuginibacillus kocurii]|uniref:transcription-repair coupling factor n=1 Tax=Salsuginibacillus kocurii TaxID=427078 RepID=UPI00037252CA|nr:transcription-repair coupling factor [Salsuginibacillus kocurii]
MRGLEEIILRNPELNKVRQGLEDGVSEQLITGLSGASKPLFMSGVQAEMKQPQLLITHNLYQAQKWYEDLQDVLGDDVQLYPVNELISSEIAVASPEMRGQRIDVLNRLLREDVQVVIVPIAGLRRLLPPKDLWSASQTILRVGEEIDIDSFLAQLPALGYTRADMVSAPGEFSVRGGIIDIYPLTEEFPVRIDLFDTEVDSLRHFQAEDQRSLDPIHEVMIGPAEETILFQTHAEAGASQLREALATTLKKLERDEVKERASERLTEEIEQLQEGQRFQGIYKYISYLYDEPATLLSYFPENSVIFVDEISRVQEMAERLDQEEAEWHTTMLEQGEAPHNIRLSVESATIFSRIEQPRIYFSLFLRQVAGTQPETIVNINSKAMQQFHGQMPVLQNEMERWMKGNYRVVFIAADESRAKRLQNVLHDYGMEAAFVDRHTPITSGKAYIVRGQLNSGFELPLERIAVVTEEETFTKKVNRTRKKQKLSNAERIKSYSELKVGDLVVHVDHGIGKYIGIETLEANGMNEDYLLVSYAGNDKLYVPVDKIDQVQKYIGSEEKDPKIHALGGGDWKKTKRKVQSSVQDIADDLIKLYAEREASKGHAFSPDDEEQKAFEAAFPYQETEDQMRAAEEIKTDMERERPMDRLLCGDVGYGKTEVAIRAAFKAIMDGKQVALLVPTTILAKQHYDTISERFADYPINIGLLNRFRSKKQQKETLNSLKVGGIDLVIGTHRLLSKDVQFKELGFLIVDEEQRFGVTHKEKIKQLKSNIDVLTLTATPIPRTLHMSMLGVRDLSVLETPPENRFPVQTYVMEYNGALLRESIERELSRGGQVFLLYNRVDDISRMAEQVQALVPDANVTYAHGQMNEQELEARMIDFLEGEQDVLVTTTIIETGVDIPNVNTLIIYNADKMGLSQLYQIRGRVGRSNRVAYAYFTYARDKVLTEVAEQRLQAIKEFTELGSGFKIAMRDLSIRGAGNLLGAKQHGFIDSVGFDMYSQMLKEAVEERKGTTGAAKEKAAEAELDIQVEAYIPASYIADAKQKIEMYKRVKGLSSFEDLQELQDELIDRFGEYPDEVKRLLTFANIKLLAGENGVQSIKEQAGKCTIIFSEEQSAVMDGAELFSLVNELGRDVGLGTEGSQIKVVLHSKRLSSTVYLHVLEQLLKNIPRVYKQEKHA